MDQSGTSPPVSAQDADAQAADASSPAQTLWQKIFGLANGASASSETPNDTTGASDADDESSRRALNRRPQKVVPGMRRELTLQRQQSELRDNLEPVQQTPAERRAVSMDRRMHSVNGTDAMVNPRASAPDYLQTLYDEPPPIDLAPSPPPSPWDEKAHDTFSDHLDLDQFSHGLSDTHDALSQGDAASVTSSQDDEAIRHELENVWILNLSMHFRDRSKREKFFVTYREKDTLWRRVTVSLDYRNAPENSLEMDLQHTKFQREKSAAIYRAIRASLSQIQFYDTVTNLKLQTNDGQLHVHVAEDVNEIIPFPTTRTIQHLNCRRIKERDVEFDSHMSGFVYKVRVNGETLIKKEIPESETVDEFLYEINALTQLQHSRNVIQFHGVVVDDDDQHVKGLLISYAEQGALIDVIFDGEEKLSWSRRRKWARQIVEGLSEIHEAGFVQGDFTLSNIVIDHNDDAKIIDINRRGCPVGWEPPEATPLIETNQRISLYIGVKSDLFQLGMVLWAVAMQADEPESYPRPLELDEKLGLPDWYRIVVETCLADDPRVRAQAISLLHMFPGPEDDDVESRIEKPPSIIIEEAPSEEEQDLADRYAANHPYIKTVEPPRDWSYVPSYRHTFADPATDLSKEPYFYPTRGRSPPSPILSNGIGYDASGFPIGTSAWSSPAYGIAPSVSDIVEEDDYPVRGRSVTPRTSIGAETRGKYYKEAGVRVYPAPTRHGCSEDSRDDTPTAPTEANLDQIIDQPQTTEEMPEGVGNDFEGQLLNGLNLPTIAEVPSAGRVEGVLEDSSPEVEGVPEPNKTTDDGHVISQGAISEANDPTKQKDMGERPIDPVVHPVTAVASVPAQAGEGAREEPVEDPTIQQQQHQQKPLFEGAGTTEPADEVKSAHKSLQTFLDPAIVEDSCSLSEGQNTNGEAAQHTSDAPQIERRLTPHHELAVSEPVPSIVLEQSADQEINGVPPTSAAEPEPLLLPTIHIPPIEDSYDIGPDSEAPNRGDVSCEMLPIDVVHPTKAEVSLGAPSSTIAEAGSITSGGITRPSDKATSAAVSTIGEAGSGASTNLRRPFLDETQFRPLNGHLVPKDAAEIGHEDLAPRGPILLSPARLNPPFELPGVLRGVGSAYDGAAGDGLPAYALMDDDLRALTRGITTTTDK